MGTRIAVGLAMLLAAGLGPVAGCSESDTDSDFEPRGSVSSGPATADSGNHGGERTVVQVDTGRWDNDVMMPTLVDYLEARQVSMRERRVTPQLLSTATFQWVQQQRRAIADAKRRGWTVPAKARMRVVGVQSGGRDAIVKICMWGPSVDFVDAETGQPVASRERQWKPFDVKMVQASNRWYVAAAAAGTFACDTSAGRDSAG